MMHFFILPSFIIALLCCTNSVHGQEKPEEPKDAEAPERTGSLPLPPGMARADDPGQIAALYSEREQERVESSRQHASESYRLSPQEEYHQMLIAHRTQLRKEQLELKIHQQNLELEREARIRAEKRAAELERARRQEWIYLQHQHSVHAYQRRLNDEYAREQRLLHLIKGDHCVEPHKESHP